MLLTVLAGFLVAQFLNRPFGESWFLGFLLSLSSTVIVFRLLEARSETTSGHGRLITGILIFQDIIIVPMMLLTPILGGVEAVNQSVEVYLFILLAKGVLLVLFVLFLATKVIPKLFFFITKTRSRELFLLSVLAVCFSVAMLSEWMGLSISIGAFLAGLIMSETEHSHQALGDILPLQDIFTSFFFVSIGMLLDVQFAMDNIFLILLITAGVMFLKANIVSFVGIVMGIPLRTVFLSALALCQVGEFSFVLVKSGLEYGIGTDFYYQLFLSVTILSMGLTPFLLQASHSIADLLMRLPVPSAIKLGLRKQEEFMEKHYQDHVIIVGYGICGKNLAQSCLAHDIDYVIIELNSETVRNEKKRGEPIIYGDASHEAVLKHANIQYAKSLAIAVSDTKSTMRIVKNARRLNSALYIVARVRYVSEAKEIYKQGANDVVADEHGSSLELFTKVLHEYNVPFDEIEDFAMLIRKQGYEKLLEHEPLPKHVTDAKSRVQLKIFHVGANSFVDNKTLEEVDLQKEYGVWVDLIKRQDTTIRQCNKDTKLLAGDEIVLYGSVSMLHDAQKLFHKKLLRV